MLTNRCRYRNRYCVTHLRLRERKKERKKRERERNTHTHTHTHTHTRTHARTRARAYTYLFLLFFSLYFSVASVQSIFEGKNHRGEKRARAVHTRALVCVVFAKSSGTRSFTFQSLRIATERERGRERKIEWVPAISRHGESDDGMRVRG